MMKRLSLKEILSEMDYRATHSKQMAQPHDDLTDIEHDADISVESPMEGPEEEGKRRGVLNRYSRKYDEIHFRNALQQKAKKMGPKIEKRVLDAISDLFAMGSTRRSMGYQELSNISHEIPALSNLIKAYLE